MRTALALGHDGSTEPSPVKREADDADRENTRVGRVSNDGEPAADRLPGTLDNDDVVLAVDSRSGPRANSQSTSMSGVPINASDSSLVRATAAGASSSRAGRNR